MTAEPNIYPQYCFHLSPTLNHWCHFRAADLVRLKRHPGFEGQDIYFHLNHPIKWVRVCGLVVAIHELDGRRIYTIDDSSGATIECVLNVPRAFGVAGPAVGTAEWNYKVKEDTTGRKFASVDGPIDVGHVLDIKGSADVFRDEMQVDPDKIKHIHTTEQEAQFWAKAAQLRKDVLDKPWVLDSKLVRDLRREAEGRKLKRRETGLEKHGARRQRGNTDAEELSNPHPHPRHRETGLEPATKKRKVDEEEKSHAIHRHRETGLEPKSKRWKMREGEQPQITRPRHVQTGLEPIAKHRVVEEGPLYTIRPCHTTGLERTVSRQKDEGEGKSGATRPHFRETGLEPIRGREVDQEGKTRSARPLETELEPTRTRKAYEGEAPRERVRMSGLERHSFQTSRVDSAAFPESSNPETLLLTHRTAGNGREAAKPLTVRSRITGLERQPLRTKEQAGGLASLGGQNKRIQPEEQSSGRQLTGLEKQSRPKRETGIDMHINSHRLAGLESQWERKEEDQTSSKPHAHHPTGLEAQNTRRKEDSTGSLSTQHCVTGLERGGGTEAADSHVLQENVDQWDIGRPGKQVLVRGRMRTTGLERRVKAVTRVPPVTDQYDVTD
ncbi:hypothetical protein QBC43DRAFT_17088 [Cladorrhinum sp. PSN259]|nr:hypothetical protein QBC43DRAFT_17088 [Cladorrhinum sp. PSN259]